MSFVDFVAACRDVGFDTLLGKTVYDIKVHKGEDRDGDRIEFWCHDDTTYVMYHMQDCCESVCIEDISGDVADLVGSPILLAEESTTKDNGRDPDEYADNSQTWTFYKLATAKGHVTIRWYSTSNGYYSERVTLATIKKD